MQQQPPAIAPAPPTPPLPPVLLGEGGASGIGGGFRPGMPLTESQREAIEEARSLLSEQLISASGRRDDLADALRRAEGADRAGIEQRLIQLDNRIIQLETDIAETGRALTAAPIEFFSGTLVQPPLSGLPPGNITAISIVFTLFVLAPIALAFARLLWKRATASRQAAPSLESIQRLERVEQAIDAVAVEVERISEGQRFVTRILTEGPAQSVLVPRREVVRVPRDEG